MWPGDYSSLACIPNNISGKSELKVKDSGILAGVELADQICGYVDPELKFSKFLEDGTEVSQGMKAFELGGNVQTILKVERLLLNCMQRMSGISTMTSKMVKLIEGTGTRLLDTRKTTPGIRFLEKWAVRIGGGVNHRFGLYDMIMLKDNHVDAAGGIENAILRTIAFQKENNLNLSVEIETRNLAEVEKVLEVGNITRIMLDNFTPSLIKEALKLIKGKYETEASGNINLENIQTYAETGVNFISSSQMTHSVKSLDLSLKIKNA